MPRLYQICVAHYLDETWNEWFEGLTLNRREDGTTLLMGVFNDATGVHNVLNKIRNLNLDLVSVSFREIAEDCDEVQ